MECRNLLQRLLEILLWLLRLLAQYFDRPTRLLTEKREELVEELVPGHTSHALECALLWLLFRALQGSVRKEQSVNKLETHDKIVEQRSRTDTNPTAEHIDASSATADPSILDPSDLPLWCIILPSPLFHLPHIRRIHHRP